MSPVYWKPKYGTRSSRHRAWARQEARREAGIRPRRTRSLRQRVAELFRR
jgi:hypothetical protein